MNFFLYHRKTRPTGRVLAQALGVEAGVEVRPNNPEVLIRWGNAQFPDIDRRAGNVLNTASAINTAGDKLRSLRLLSEAGVTVPKFSVEPPRDGTWLGRNRRGFGGKDIVVYQQGVKAVGGGVSEFFTEFIPNEREYRLHVVGGNVVRVQRKYLERPEARASEFIKNHKNGYVFKAPQRSLRQNRLEMAVQSVEALGLSFGAVDAVVDYDGTMYVLEVNTAPACAPLTAQAYTDGLRGLLQ
jgi:predicted ATP-grasp superfamily ATP-dependent carboligase